MPAVFTWTRVAGGGSINVPSSWTYNLDTLSTSGGNAADLWWHVISNNVKFLDRYMSCRMRLLWTI